LSEKLGRPIPEGGAGSPDEPEVWVELLLLEDELDEDEGDWLPVLVLSLVALENRLSSESLGGEFDGGGVERNGRSSLGAELDAAGGADVGVNAISAGSTLDAVGEAGLAAPGAFAASAADGAKFPPVVSAEPAGLACVPDGGLAPGPAAGGCGLDGDPTSVAAAKPDAPGGLFVGLAFAVRSVEDPDPDGELPTLAARPAAGARVPRPGGLNGRDAGSGESPAGSRSGSSPGAEPGLPDCPALGCEPKFAPVPEPEDPAESPVPCPVPGSLAASHEEVDRDSAEPPGLAEPDAVLPSVAEVPGPASAAPAPPGAPPMPPGLGDPAFEPGRLTLPLPVTRPADGQTKSATEPGAGPMARLPTEPGDLEPSAVPVPVPLAEPCPFRARPLRVAGGLSLGEGLGAGTMGSSTGAEPSQVARLSKSGTSTTRFWSISS
jgi:hypothetical protein